MKDSTTDSRAHGNADESVRKRNKRRNVVLVQNCFPGELAMCYFFPWTQRGGVARVAIDHTNPIPALGIDTTLIHGTTEPI